MEATTSPEEGAFNSFCGAPAFEHAVWFTATSTLDGDVAVDVSASDYSAGILVLTGTPGDLTPINCGPGRIGGPVTAGQTYYLLVFGDGLTTPTSGNLVLTIANVFPLNIRLESPVAPLTFGLELAGGNVRPRHAADRQRRGERHAGDAALLHSGSFGPGPGANRPGVGYAGGRSERQRVVSRW